MERPRGFVRRCSYCLIGIATIVERGAIRELVWADVLPTHGLQRERADWRFCWSCAAGVLMSVGTVDRKREERAL